jgi:hypothetical protein
MTLLLAVLARSGGNSPLGILFIFAVGALLFFLGFQSYRRYRILADTPIMPIRSIAMGLTHARGKATGDDRLTGPLTGAPCFYYWVKVEKFKQGKHGGWAPVSNEMDRRPFYLDDGTAKVLVNAPYAEFNVPPTFSYEIGPKLGSKRFVEPSLGVAGPSEQDLRTYLAGASDRARAALAATNAPGLSAAAKTPRVGYNLAVPGISAGSEGLSLDFAAHHYRFTEECLLADRDCTVMGTCVENPRPKDDHNRNLITRGENEKTFLITSLSEQKSEKGLRKQALVLILIGSFIIIMAAVFALGNAGLL